MLKKSKQTLWSIKNIRMRKIVLVLALMSTIPVFGQNHFIGLKGGINWSNINISSKLKGQNRTGFTNGLTYEYQPKKKFHIELDLIYAQKGFKMSNTRTDENGNDLGEYLNEFNYDYLSFPIKGGLSIGNNNVVFLNLGVVPSLLINAKQISPSLDYTQTKAYTYTRDMTDFSSKFDFGGLIEIEGRYKFKERFLLFTSFSYQHSFTTINKDSKDKHYSMTLLIGLKYALKKE